MTPDLYHPARFKLTLLAVFSTALICPRVTHGEDWPTFGRDRTRNAVSPERNPPLEWQIRGAPKKTVDDKVVERFAESRNVKWVAQLGRFTTGAPVVSQGLVWMGTNNAHPRDPKFKNDASVLMCFRETDGKFLYQYCAPRLLHMFHDWPSSSLGSVPLVEGDRLWFVTNRWEVVCLDVSDLRRQKGQPRLIWKVDMMKDLGVSPRCVPMGQAVTCSIGPSYRELIYVITGNGVDEGAVNIPAPLAPSLVCFDRNTGKVVWSDRSPGKNILDGQWASPLVIEIEGRGQVIAPQGDGWVRSFDALTGELIWKFDTNPKDSKWMLGGRGTRNSILGTPVYFEGRIYIANGQDPEHGEGVGHLYCLNPTMRGDISMELEAAPGKGRPNPKSGLIWHYGGTVPRELEDKLKRTVLFNRTPCTCVVHDGLVYVADVSGNFHCLDARTGKHYWEHDLGVEVRGSACWVDGTVYQGTEDGDVWIFSHGREKKQPRKIDMDDVISTSPIFANGVLYIATHQKLYALEARQK
jgi:outer membrane protein assembly factor BamB